MNRCEWAKDDLMIKYHDKEWGIPVHDDRKLFEMLILEGAQAGLTWLTVLKRREEYRKAFDNFDPHKVSKYDAKDIARLLKNAGIIRNKLKIKSAINNAKRFLEIQNEFGTFDKYLWSFIDYKPIINNYKNLASIPPYTSLSDKLSKDLKNRGFSFVGSTICYAFLQSVGVVNDHLVDCFTRKK
ncbi:MAG: DNA-3-methyladenine glycosylase I [Nitrosopumilaceae archaeon]